MKRVALAFFASMSVTAPLSLPGQGSGAGFTGMPVEVRRVLVIGAHPDDEDTQLIAWLQRGGHAETAYLSLTRGDGGQNLIGNELGEALGVVRTEELMAARRVDGAHQFFTRAYDFGFSKTAEETFAHWPKDSLLNDVVTVVRSWRPHVIVAIFSGTPRDGHGQHQVSAILAREAYEAAMDTSRFPESQFGPAWTPLKFYRASWFTPQAATLRMNVGEYNESLRKSYAEIAGESRSQHKSQGFGALQRKGVVWDQVVREATRVNEGTPAKSEVSIFDGIPDRTAASVGQVVNFAAHVAVEAFADRQSLALGDSALVTVTLYNRSRRAVEVSPVAGRSGRLAVSGEGVQLVAPDSSYSWKLVVKGEQLTQPWWLTAPRTGDLFSPPLPVLRDPKRWRAMPEDEREKADWAGVSISNGAGSDVLKHTPIVYRYVDLIRGEIQRPLAVAPAISVALDRTTELARADTHIDRYFNVTLRSAMLKAAPVTIALNVPAGLVADSASRTLILDSAATRSITFRVRGKIPPGVHEVSASAVSAGRTYASGYVPVEYEHINPQRMYRPARVAINAIDIKVPQRLSVGYIKGVGDNVEPALEQLGIPVTIVDAHALPTVDLHKFSTVVVGPRAYQASSELVYNNPYLLTYAKNGGTLVVQYGQYEMTRPGMMPYAISIARPHDRVTLENAPITILDASSPALRTPNAITARDFSGWVQERGLYMPRTFDAHYHPIVALNDPGEPVNRGGIIVTPYGKGLYVYTTLAFFRQLPAGVPGASKLFVNLLSMTNNNSSAKGAVSAGH